MSQSLKYTYPKHYIQIRLFRQLPNAQKAPIQRDEGLCVFGMLPIIPLRLRAFRRRCSSRARRGLPPSSRHPRRDGLSRYTCTSLSSCWVRRIVYHTPFRAGGKKCKKVYFCGSVSGGAGGRFKTAELAAEKTDRSKQPGASPGSSRRCRWRRDHLHA